MPETITYIPAYEIVDAVLTQGGITVHPITGERPSEGWAVSCCKENERTIPLDDLDPERIFWYLYDNADRWTRDTDSYLGAWVENGLVYLDVTTVVDDLDTAVRLGVEHDQIAVYNLGTGETVYCDAPVDVPVAD